MPILQQQAEQAVRKRFDIELKRDVTITLYAQRNIAGLYIPGRECESCGPTEQLLEEVSALSPRIHLDIVDFYGDPEEAKARGVDKIPASIISADGRDNVKFFGLPSGSEFAVLLDTIVNSSVKTSSLKLDTRRWLKRLQDDVHIQVFVTPN